MADNRYDRRISTPPMPPTPPPPWAAPGVLPPRAAPARRPAFAALAVAISSWLRPLPDNKPTPTGTAEPTFSNQQTSDAKAAICSARAQVCKAGDVAGARDGGTDPTSTLTVATSTRQVLDAGSRYLITKLNSEPATPPDHAAAVRKLADVYQQMAVDYLDGLSNSDPELVPLLKAGDQAHSTIQDLCK